LFTSIGLVPLLDMYGSLFEGMNDIIAHIAPPITTVFLLGVLWPRANAYSARWTLWLGSFMGAAIFFVNKCFPKNPLAGIPFMMMAFYLFVFCVALQVMLVATSKREIRDPGWEFGWETPFLAIKEKGWPGLANYRVLAVLVILVYIGLYTAFG
jgi:SSS family solute:Na+ symporter